MADSPAFRPGRTGFGPAPAFAPLCSVPGTYASYVWQNVGITLWFAPASVEDLGRYRQGCERCVEGHPEGVSSVHIMVPGTQSMPTAEARAEIVNVLREFAPTTAAAAVVIPGTGFWPSALRSMVTALGMLGRRSYPMRIFGALEDASQWLPPLHCARTSVRISSHELLRVLREAEADARAACGRPLL